MSGYATLLLAAVTVVAGCTSQPPEAEEAIVLTSAADTVAMMAYESTGGEAWNEVPFLRFDFAVERGGNRGRTRRHLWNRMSGDYRLEVPVSGDSTAVVLFNVNTRQGKAFVNGAEVTGPAQDRLLESAYEQFINDSYWLMAPAKVFDPGVTRTYLPDSSSAEAAIIHLSFENVGLTPGDQYWMRVDRESGRLMGWTYLLQGSDRKSTFQWTEYREFEMPGGVIRLAERKDATDGSRSILTDHVALPRSVPAELFSSPAATME